MLIAYETCRTAQGTQGKAEGRVFASVVTLEGPLDADRRVILLTGSAGTVQEGGWGVGGAATFTAAPEKIN